MRPQDPGGIVGGVSAGAVAAGGIAAGKAKARAKQKPKPELKPELKPKPKPKHPCPTLPFAAQKGGGEAGARAPPAGGHALLPPLRTAQGRAGEGCFWRETHNPGPVPPPRSVPDSSRCRMVSGTLRCSSACDQPVPALTPHLGNVSARRHDRVGYRQPLVCPYRRLHRAGFRGLPPRVRPDQPARA